MRLLKTILFAYFSQKFIKLDVKINVKLKLHDETLEKFA